MKTFIVALCFIATVVAQAPAKGDKKGHHELPAGCANPPKDMKLSQCCPNMPNFFSQELMIKNCSTTCEAAKKAGCMCCMTDCILNAFGSLTDGKFDAVKAKQSFGAMAASDPAWTSVIIGGVIDGCVDSAPGKLNSFRSNLPKKFSPNCTEATSLNMVIGHCIRRELFFQCPGMSTSDDCKALLSYGRGCSIFPYHKEHHGDHNGDVKKGNGKEGGKHGGDNKASKP